MDIIQAQQISMSFYAILVPSTILIYDHMATLTDEIAFIWCRPKAQSAILFLLNRYVALLGNIYGLVGVFLPTSDESCPTYTLSKQVLVFSQAIIVCLILTLRTYALYGRSKRLLAFLVIVGLAFAGGAATETFGRYASTVTNVPGGCYETFTAETNIRLGIAWVALSVYELLIFILTVSRIFGIRELLQLSLTMSRRNIIVVIFQDGAMYFGAMTLFNIPNILTYYCGSDITRGTLSTFTSCMSVTLISRLMLNLHKSIDAGIFSAPTRDDDDGLAVFTTRVDVQSTMSSHHWLSWMSIYGCSFWEYKACLDPFWRPICHELILTLLCLLNVSIVTKMGLFLPRSCIHLATFKLRVTTIARPRMMGMSSAISKRVKGSREHVSVSLTPEEKIRVDDQIFFEEPLGLPAWDSFGWPQLEFNEAIGPDDRYVICRKLGWGIYSSTWLARDKINNSFVAVKISTGAATGLVREHNHWEIPTLYRVSSSPNSHCLRNLSHFTMPGKGSSGEHDCSVMQILGGSLIDLRKTHGPVLPLPLAKRILLHTLRGITHIHSRGAVHTNLCLEAIFLDAHMSNSDIEKLLESDPSRRHPPEESYDGIMQAAVSQPLPVPTLQEAMQKTFVLGKFRFSIPIGAAADEINSYDHLRPPENFIRGLWEEPVDIWTFGCLIFELVTDHSLFKFQPWPLLGLDEIDYILWQMISYTGETFYPEQLGISQRAAEFFSTTCHLRRSNPPLRLDHIERCLRCYKGVEEPDIVSTAAVIRRCLRLDPADRPSAAELLKDPWFAEVDPV